MAQNISLLQAAYRFASKLFAEYALDSNGNPVGLVGPNGNAGWIDAGFFGASPSASATANVAAIQAALNYANSQGGGRVTITTPGVYQFAGAQANIGNGSTIPWALADYACCTIYDNTEFYTTAGVTLQGPTGGFNPKPLLANSNAGSTHKVVSSNTGVLAGWGAATYTQSTTTVTISGLVGNTLVAGQLLSLQASGGTGVNGKLCTITSASSTGIVATSTGSQTVGSATAIALIAYTPPNVLTNPGSYQWIVQFTTSTAHGLTAGGFVLFKGDTSLFNWNHTWKILATPTPTTFTLAVYYDELPQTISGTVWSYAANDNIKVTIDGQIDGQMNYNFGATTFSLLSAAMLYFNKVGTVKISGNFINAVAICSCSNIDNLIGQSIKHTYGANAFQCTGPIRNIYLRDSTVSHTEEYLFASPTDSSGIGPFEVDSDNTNNSGGSIDNIIVDGISGAYMSNKLLSFGIDANYINGTVSSSAVNAYAIGNISISHVRTSQSNGGPNINIGQVTGATGTLNKISIKDWEADLITNSPLFELEAQTLTIGTIELDGFNMVSGGASQTQWGVLPNYYGSVVLLAGVGTSGTINKIKLANIDTPLWAQASGNPYTAFVLSAAGWNINSLEASNLTFTEVGTGTIPSTAIGTTALKVKISKCSVLALNAGCVLLQSRGASAIVDLMQCTQSGAVQGNLVQPYTSQTITIVDGDVSSGPGIPVLWNGVQNLTVNLSIGGMKMGSGQVYAYNFSGTNTINIRSLGGNINPNGTHFAAAGSTTFTLSGNCSDINIDMAIASRNSGCIFTTTNATAKTGFVAGDLVFCDAAGAQGISGSNVFHAMKSPLLVTY